MKRFCSLLIHYSFRALIAERVYVILAFLGISLSVSLFASIRLANTTVLREFRGAVDSIAGTSALQIIPRSESFAAEDIIPVLRALPEVQSLFPIREERGTLRGVAQGGDRSQVRTGVAILGVDIFQRELGGLTEQARIGRDSSAPEEEERSFSFLRYNEAIVSSKLREQIGASFAEISSPSGKVYRLLLSELPLEAEQEESLFSVANGEVLVADLSLVDELFESPGRLTKVNVVPKPGTSVEELQQQLIELLPENVVVVTPQIRFEQISQTSEALRMNLTFLASLALLVAVLLGYQIFRLIVLRRRAHFATLISLGAVPKQLAAATLFEALSLGAIAGGVGGVLGYLLGHYTIAAVQTTIHHLYTPLALQQFELQWTTLLEATLLGLAIGCIGALAPALTVLSESPQHYFSRYAHEQEVGYSAVSLSMMALFLLLLGVGTSSPAFLSLHPLAPFVSPSLLSGGVLLLAPLLLLVIKKIVTVYHQSLSPSSLIAAESLFSRFRDSSIALGALSVTFGMLLGVSTMISSFRVTFQEWLHHVLAADLFISQQEESGRALSKGDLPAITWMRNQKEVRAVQFGLQAPYTFPARPERGALGGKTFLRGTDIELAQRESALIFLSAGEPRWSIVEEGKGVFLSEPFANKQRYAVGDQISIAFEEGVREFSVEGIYQDFSTDLGVVLFSREVLRDFLRNQESLSTGVAVYLNESGNRAGIMRRFQQEFGEDFLIRDRRGLEREAVRIFDNTFQITYVLQLLTLIISALFLILTLLLSVLDTRRQRMILRSIGAPFTFLRGLLVREVLVMVGASTVLGTFLGLLLSLALVFRINVLFFGWSVRFLFPFFEFVVFTAGFLGLSLAVTMGIATGTLRRVRGEDLRYDS